jgi:hypothetical protein
MSVFSFVIFVSFVVNNICYYPRNMNKNLIIEPRNSRLVVINHSLEARNGISPLETTEPVIKD